MAGKNLKVWLEELRAPFFTATVVPVVLGALIAWKQDNVFNFGWFALTLLGIILLHAGTNVINDYFDHKSGNDEINTEFIRPFSGGSRVIQNGLLTPRQVLALSLSCFALGSLIGLYLVRARGIEILILGLVGVLSGYFYSAPPVRLAGSGWGEFIVGLNFGILVVLGSYFVQVRHLAWEPVLAALPVSFLIAAVLYINEFPDYTADKAVGKNSLVVRLGKEKAVAGYIFLMTMTFISTLIAALAGIVSPFALLIFLTLPIALKAMQTARLHFNQTSALVPANAATILCHLLGGILISAGYVLHKLILG